MKITGLWFQSGLVGQLGDFKDSYLHEQVKGGTTINPPVITLLPKQALKPLLPVWKGLPVPVQTKILNELKKIRIPDLELYETVAEISEIETAKKTWIAPLKKQKVNDYVRKLGITLTNAIYDNAGLSLCKDPLPSMPDVLDVIKGLAKSRCFYVTLANNRGGDPWKSLGGLTRKTISAKLGLDGRVGKGPSVGMLFAELSGNDDPIPKHPDAGMVANSVAKLLPELNSPKAKEILDTVSTNITDGVTFYYGGEGGIDESEAVAKYPNAKWIAVSYSYGSYEGSGTALISMPDGTYHIEDCSHCSCNGPVEGWVGPTAEGFGRTRLFELLDKDLNGATITSDWSSEELPMLWKAVKAALLIEIGLSKAKQDILAREAIEQSIMDADLDLA